MSAVSDKSVVAKLTVKGALANPKKASVLELGDRTKVYLGRIGGVATGIKSQEDQRDGKVYTAIVGNFQGVHGETGEVKASGKLYLPGGIQEMIEEPLRAAKDAGTITTVQFALDLYAVRADNPQGYAYEGVPMFDGGVKNPVDDMFAALPPPKHMQPALPKPDAEKETASPSHDGKGKK